MVNLIEEEGRSDPFRVEEMFRHLPMEDILDLVAKMCHAACEKQAESLRETRPRESRQALASEAKRLVQSAVFNEICGS